MTKNVYRNPVYIVYILLAVVIFALMVEMSSVGVRTFEEPLFRLCNNLPQWLYVPFLLMSTFGSLVFSWFVAIVFAIFRRYRAALRIFIATTIAFVVAYGLKLLEIRQRPEFLLPDVIVREDAGSFGVPSGHAAVATALAFMLYQYIPVRFHGYITGIAIGTFASRMYLGVHLPLDLIAGFAIGLLVGAIVNYVFGTKNKTYISHDVIMTRARKIGLQFVAVERLHADARGSVPYIAHDSQGKNYFIKIVSNDNYIADWLFKSWRKLVYRRLEDELPFLSPKQQIEHESYVAGLAYANDIKTPIVYGVFKVGNNAWAQVQQGIDGVPLGSVPQKDITDTMLLQTWSQVKKMHDVGIIHRDLRAANIFVDSRKTPWIIDFGFAESSMDETQLFRDIVELIGSTAVLVGAERAVAAAVAIEGQERIRSTLPYMSYAVMSSATTKAMKSQNDLLAIVQQEMKKVTHVDVLPTIRMRRINRTAMLYISGALLFFYVLLPFMGVFSGSVNVLLGMNLWWIVIAAALFSATYFVEALIYIMLAEVVLPFGRTVVMNIAMLYTQRFFARKNKTSLVVRYLQAQGHGLSQSSAIVVVNNVLLFASFSLISLVLLTVYNNNLQNMFIVYVDTRIMYAILVGGLLLAIPILVFTPLKHVIQKYFKKLHHDITLLSVQPLRILFALLGSGVIVVLNTGILYATISAFGLAITSLQALFVLSVGAIGAILTPTPGGVGGAELGIIVSMGIIGAIPEVSLAVALVYRMITYWLPMIPGYYAYKKAIKNNYVSYVKPIV